MKKLLTKLNHYFIDEDTDSVSRHDELWFYGPIALMMFIVMIVMISTLITKY